METNTSGSPLVIKKGRRKKGIGANISVYFTRECFDMINHIRKLADDGKLRSSSDFISQAVLEKYNRDILKGD
jgi:hypothetical protein